MQENKPVQDNKQQYRYNPQRSEVKSAWINRNPRLFVTLTSSAALLVFFSRPIYDFFISNDRPDIQEIQKMQREFKSRIH